eukprot:TRINITY_DN4172_c0_g1_i2.p1 TRINITY_DN4172_c0_g1~~TRINITY_DN4172_c0_g1_i2.p1  ORF type:complete len:175 (-),score=55.84 TRINITY_DN4172_c0_g1_i2:112-636(-)
MSKVPNFYQFKFNGNNTLSHEAKGNYNSWQIYLIDSCVPEDGGFSFTVRIHEMIRFTNSWGLQVGVVYSEDCSEFDGRYGTNYYIGSESKGCGYIAMNGQKEFLGGAGRDYGAKYGPGDEIKTVIHKNKDIEFFKNDESQGIAHTLDKFPVIPCVVVSSTTTIEIIDIRSLEDE